MKILFSSINCLLDPSSGAAISVRSILELLNEAGAECMSFTSASFDKAPYEDDAQNLTEAGLEAENDPSVGAIWCAPFNQVTHYAIPLGTYKRGLIGRLNEIKFLELAKSFIRHHKPDIVITYGGGVYELELRKWLKKEGISNVYYLAHPGYKTMKTFENANLVVTDSLATHDLYKERMNLVSKVIGKFIKPPIAPDFPIERKYVTLINPSAEKGVTLFFRIVQVMQSILPNVRFLVVESRNTLERVEQRTGLPFSQFRSIRRIGLQDDMGEVFAQTKILLMPSVWHDSGPRSAVEACSQGIPVLATSMGGLPELLGEGGIIIDPPKPLLKNHWLIPPPSAAIPWVEAIAALMTEDELYDEHREASLENWKLHNPADRINDLLNTFESLISEKAP